MPGATTKMRSSDDQSKQRCKIGNISPYEKLDKFFTNDGYLHHFFGDLIRIEKVYDEDYTR